MSGEKGIIRKLTIVGIFGNVLLTAFKLFAGIAGKSSAMISDAVHSLSDVFATFLSRLGTELGNKEPDREHPYGHDKFETFAAGILGLILICTGLGIGRTSVNALINPETAAGRNASWLPIIAAAISIVCKEAMYRYTIYYADKMNSSVFRADAWHHRSDALSSVGALIGISASRFGIYWAEPAASLIICILILKIGAEILVNSIAALLDSSCGADFERRLAECVESVPGVRSIDLLRTRKFGSSAYADLEISVDRSLTVVEAHDISERVHEKVESTFKEMKHIMIHVNPCE